MKCIDENNLVFVLIVLLPFNLRKFSLIFFWLTLSHIVDKPFDLARQKNIFLGTFKTLVSTFKTSLSTSREEFSYR